MWETRWIFRREKCQVRLPEGCDRGNGPLHVRKLLTNVFYVLSRTGRRSIKARIGYRKMPSRSITVRKLGIAFVSLLLCAIFASELPELLSLTNNTANDFTMCSADPLASLVLRSTKNVRRPAVDFNNSTQDSLFVRLGPPEKAELAFCLFILYSAQRV